MPFGAPQDKPQPAPIAQEAEIPKRVCIDFSHNTLSPATKLNFPEPDIITGKLALEIGDSTIGLTTTGDGRLGVVGGVVGVVGEGKGVGVGTVVGGVLGVVGFLVVDGNGMLVLFGVEDARNDESVFVVLIQLKLPVPESVHVVVVFSELNVEFEQF